MYSTPREIILLEERLSKISLSNNTDIQKNELLNQFSTPENRLIRWEVEISNISGMADSDLYNYVLRARIRLRDPWSWLRGNHFSGWFSVAAYLKGEILRERLLTMNKGQKVLIEGNAKYYSREFTIEPANLV